MCIISLLETRVRSVADDAADRQWKSPAVSDDEGGCCDKWHDAAGFTGDGSAGWCAGGASSIGPHLAACLPSPISIAKLAINQL